jgi:hypothetical protein
MRTCQTLSLFYAAAIAVLVMSAIAPMAIAIKITQPFKELPASYADRWAKGYHAYPQGIYTQRVADDPAFSDGWNTAQTFANIKPILKETPTSYAEGWLAGYHHKQLKSGLIPMPPGNSPGWTHGFTDGYRVASDKQYRLGWLAGRHAFLNGVPNIVTGRTQQYQYGFNAGYHTNKDPYAGDKAYPIRGIPWTD